MTTPLTLREDHTERSQSHRSTERRERERETPLGLWEVGRKREAARKKIMEAERKKTRSQAFIQMKWQKWGKLIIYNNKQI